MRVAYLIYRPAEGDRWPCVGALAVDTAARDAALAGEGGPEARTLVGAGRAGAWVDALGTPLVAPYREVWRGVRLPNAGDAPTMEAAARAVLDAERTLTRVREARRAELTEDPAGEPGAGPEPGADPLSEEDVAELGRRPPRDGAHRQPGPDGDDEDEAGTGEIVDQGSPIDPPDQREGAY